ncbi:MAG: NrfD/PsrC family molybdoenzyme membrane anchor subunit [Edaphobacter sp.]
MAAKADGFDVNAGSIASAQELQFVVMAGQQEVCEMGETVDAKLRSGSDHDVANDPMIDPINGEYAVIAPGHTSASITQKISSLVLTSHTPLGWFFALIVAGGIASLALGAITWLFLKGIGIWGVTIPGAWGFAIINFVWWIGIGHAGTLISAILLLFKQSWRNSINRFAEAMTIFAVVCAGMFPLLHLGRPWLGYWLLPYPNTMNIWPQFRSPLAWDVFAVTTYATISVVFWYLGMIPDFGTLRDRAKSPIGQYFYGILSLGWRGSTRHWIRYESASLLLAGLSTPLVLSVHTVNLSGNPLGLYAVHRDAWHLYDIVSALRSLRTDDSDE